MVQRVAAMLNRSMFAGMSVGEVSSSQNALHPNAIKVALLRVLLMGMAFAVPTIVVFWQGFGLSIKDVLLLQAGFAIGLAAMEGPSGYVADRIGRKAAVSVGGLFLLAGGVAYFVSQSFAFFMIAELILAVGFALISGADQALAYDSLLESKQEHLFSRYWGKVVLLEMLFGMIAGIIGGLIANWSLRAPFALAAISFAAYLCVAISLEEPQRSKRRVEGGHFGEFIKIARHDVLGHREIRWLVALGLISFPVLQVAFWLYQPLFQLRELPLWAFGIAFASLQVIAGISAKYAASIENKIGWNVIPKLVVFGIGISLIGLGAIPHAAALLLIGIHQVARGIYRVSLAEHLNRQAQSEIRATIISIKGMFERTLYVALLLTVSSFADSAGIELVHLVLGGVMLVVGVFVALRREN